MTLATRFTARPADRAIATTHAELVTPVRRLARGCLVQRSNESRPVFIQRRLEHQIRLAFDPRTINSNQFRHARADEQHSRPFALHPLKLVDRSGHAVGHVAHPLFGLRQILHRRMQRLLAALAFVDVNIDAGSPQRFAAGVALGHHAVAVDPLPFAVFSPYALVDLVGRLRALHRRLDLFAHRRNVLGMHLLFQIFDTDADGLTPVCTGHFGPLPAQIHNPPGNIEIPKHQIGGAHGQRQAFAGDFKFRLDLCAAAHFCFQRFAHQKMVASGLQNIELSFVGRAQILNQQQLPRVRYRAISLQRPFVT